jgi:hypothetical protein
MQHLLWMNGAAFPYLAVNEASCGPSRECGSVLLWRASGRHQD